MRSDARERLHLVFETLAVGQQFQIVNTAMGGALPNSPVYEKIDGEHYNARRVGSVDIVRIRPSAKVEISSGGLSNSGSP